MKKHFLMVSIIITIITLSSCKYIPTNNKIQEPYIVESIGKFSDVYCKYNLSTGVDYIEFKDDITIIDSIGKFNIGDSVRVNIYKSK